MTLGITLLLVTRLDSTHSPSSNKLSKSSVPSTSIGSSTSIFAKIKTMEKLAILRCAKCYLSVNNNRLFACAATSQQDPVLYVKYTLKYVVARMYNKADDSATTTSARFYDFFKCKMLTLGLFVYYYFTERDGYASIA